MDLQKTFEKVFGSYNSREIKKLEKFIPKIHKAEEPLKNLSDDELKQKFADWKTELTENPEKVDDKMVEIFAGIREAASFPRQLLLQV